MEKQSTDFIQDLEETLPDFISATDLVKLGIFSSPAAVRSARKAGQLPTHLQISTRNVRYPKKYFIEWIIKNTKRNKNEK